MLFHVLDRKAEVRREADLESPLIATLSRGDSLEVEQNFWNFSDWTGVRLPDGKTGYMLGQTGIFSPRVVRTLGEQTLVRAGASPVAEVLARLGPGAQLSLVRPAGDGEEPWFEITHDGKPGFIAGDVLVERVVQHRFCVERVTFIVATALILGTVIGLMQSEMPTIGIIALIGFLVFGFYYTAGYLTDTNWFWDAIPIEEEMPPSFDWTRLVLEPLFFLGAIVLVFIAACAAALVRWALSGN